jgi:hypothetical protein
VLSATTYRPSTEEKCAALKATYLQQTKGGGDPAILEAAKKLNCAWLQPGGLPPPSTPAIVVPERRCASLLRSYQLTKDRKHVEQALRTFTSHGFEYTPCAWAVAVEEEEKPRPWYKNWKVLLPMGLGISVATVLVVRTHR